MKNDFILNQLEEADKEWIKKIIANAEECCVNIQLEDLSKEEKHEFWGYNRGARDVLFELGLNYEEQQNSMEEALHKKTLN